MDVHSFKYAKVVSIVLATLFVIGMAIMLIPALRFTGWIYIYRILVYLIFSGYFIMLLTDTDRLSSLRTPALLGIIGFVALTFYVFLYWTEISKYSIANWHEALAYITSAVSLFWLCKFFRTGSRLQYAAILVGAIMLLTLIVEVSAREMLTNAIMDYVNEGKDMEKSLKTHLVLFQVENYSKIGLSLFSAWFMYEYSLIKK